MRDNRAVKSELFNVIAEGGPLHDIIRFIKDNNKIEGEELELCFRGNSDPGYITIYYKNHIVFRISGTDINPKVEISTNQGRYTENWHDEYLILGLDLSIKEVKKKNPNKNSKVKYVYSYVIKQGDYVQIKPKSGKYDYGFWQESWIVLSRILDNYFSEEKDYDYYRKSFGVEQTGRKKDLKIEKQAQQRLFTKFNSFSDGLYFYDLEYMQKGDISLNKNKPDALAIEYIKGKASSLIYVEVKSLTKSIDGESGLSKHLLGMQDYIEKSRHKGLIENRVEEADMILTQYRTLGIRSVPDKPFSDTEKEKLKRKQKIMVILTDYVERDYLSDPEVKKKIDEQIDEAKSKSNIEILFYLERDL